MRLIVELPDGLNTVKDIFDYFGVMSKELREMIEKGVPYIEAEQGDLVSRLDVMNAIYDSHYGSTEAYINLVKTLPHIESDYNKGYADGIKECTPGKVVLNVDKVRGSWKYDPEIDHTKGHCTACGHYARYGEFTNFCPDCGADMRKEDI